MRTDTAKKQALKRLARLLRVLSRDHAVLIREKNITGEPAVYGVYAVEEGCGKLLMRPEPVLAGRCVSQDLLTRTGNGWVIGANGRLALKRMLAGSEPFAEQHQERRMHRRKIGDSKQNVVVNDRASPLGWLLQHTDASGQPMISKTQFAAGERLARDFQFAGLAPRITSSWSNPGTGGQKRAAPGAGQEISDNALAARQRVRTAVNEVGNDLADILLDICCFQLGLVKVEKARNWPRRSGKIILQIALDRLAAHYGMTSKGKPNDKGSYISHWGAEGYKPTVG